MKPRQLLLDIHPVCNPTLEDFVVGGNSEVLARLKAMSEPRALDQIYLWGQPGCGRSHLLRGTLALALASNRPALFVEAAALGDELVAAPGSLVIVDNVEALNEEAQITLFRTFNAARLIGLSLLLSGHEPPLRLALREDLRTRIAAMLVYEVHPLTDEQKTAALLQHASGRGMNLEPALIDYLLQHGRRDLPTLLATLDALDLMSLEQQRPLTLPLLREILQRTAAE
jgi:DnaA family protein